MKKSPVIVSTVEAGAHTVETAVMDGGNDTVTVVLDVAVQPFALETVTV